MKKRVIKARTPTPDADAELLCELGFEAWAGKHSVFVQITAADYWDAIEQVESQIARYDCALSFTHLQAHTIVR